MSPKARLGWGPFFEEQIRASEQLASRGVGLRFARVVEEQRGLYRVAGDVEGLAEISGRFRHEAKSLADFPAVGDWVGVGHRSIIQCRLDRRSAISRAAAGRGVEEQIIAANVDVIFVVTDATGDLNANRLERYLTMVWDAGATPVIVVNKADLVMSPHASVEALRNRLPLVDLIALSALSGDGLQDLAAYLQPAQTIALVGSSGVGKSTLVNRLLGRDAVRVGDVRTSDGRGRHTTTARQLVVLSGGALLIDTPGMRELQPWVDSPAVDVAFDDIATLAAGCRFADCAHEREPDCAVLSALATGALDANRLESYRRLVREAAFEERKRDASAAANTKRRWKQLTRAQRAMYRDRQR